METLNDKTQSYRSLYSMVEQVKCNGLVIYGAGFWGRLSWQIFALFDVTPVCFCDDNLDKQGTYLIRENDKVPIISLDEAAEKYPNAVYISAATGGPGKAMPRQVMDSRLSERGLVSEYSEFHPVKYLFLLEGGLEALRHPDQSSSTGFQIENFKNMIISNHMINSGSLYFNTLMDGHPNIVTIALLAFFKVKYFYQKYLQYLEGEELVLEIASHMTPYFASKFPDEVYLPVSDRLANPWVLNQNGWPEERVYIDSTKFITALSNLLSGQGKVSYAVLIKAIHAAYADSIGKIFDPKQTYWIYHDWHRANFDISEMDELLSPNDFDRLEYWFIIREPVQHWFSYLNRSHKQSGVRLNFYAGKPHEYVAVLSSELGLVLEKTEAAKNKTVKVVRFEDAKRKTRATMQAVSKWMDIPFDESMLNSTVNGIPVYFPSVGNTREVISSADTTAVDRRDFSRFLSSYDIFRLNLAFQNFKKAYGYGCDVPDYRDFSPEFLRELYRHPFRFEAALDAQSAEAKRIGYLSPDERPFCHEYITNLLIGYMQKDKPELITDVIWPQEAEIEE